MLPLLVSYRLLLLILWKSELQTPVKVFHLVALGIPSSLCVVCVFFKCRVYFSVLFCYAALLLDTAYDIARSSKSLSCQSCLYGICQLKCHEERISVLYLFFISLATTQKLVNLYHLKHYAGKSSLLYQAPLFQFPFLAVGLGAFTEICRSTCVLLG